MRHDIDLVKAFLMVLMMFLMAVGPEVPDSILGPTIFSEMQWVLE
jgi:hypothetical protein